MSKDIPLNEISQRRISLAKQLVERLSPREQEIARYATQGCNDKEIARQLNIEVATVRTHVSNIVAKAEAIYGQKVKFRGKIVNDLDCYHLCFG